MAMELSPNDPWMKEVLSTPPVIAKEGPPNIDSKQTGVTALEKFLTKCDGAQMKLKGNETRWVEGPTDGLGSKPEDRQKNIGEIEKTAKVWKTYLENQAVIEDQRETYQEAIEQSREFIRTLEQSGSLSEEQKSAIRQAQRTTKNLESEAKQFEQTCVPTSISLDAFEVEAAVSRQEPLGNEFLDLEKQLLSVAKDEQIKLSRERNEKKHPEIRMARERAEKAEAEAEKQKARANAAEARAKAAEERARQLRDELMEKMKEADEKNAELQRQLEEANTRAAAEIEREQLQTPPPGENQPEEPALEVEALENVAPVDTRNRLKRIRDGIVERFDPRDKDWLWRIGAVAGVGEAIAVSFAPIPGGRIAASALNFLAAQGINMGVEGLRRAEIARARGEVAGNDLIQRILDINDRHRVASDRAKNFFAGLSAGMTVGSIGTLIYGAVEGFVAPHPVVATETPQVIAKEAIKPTEILNPKIIIPDHGNFWSAWHIDSTNWVDLKNGTTHTDVIKDMVVKLARHNGHELGLVHAGDQIELGKVLTSEQLELVKKAAAAKSYAEYSQAIRPAFHVLLKK